MVPLLDLPHAEARRALSGGAPVFLPVNPVEYHGPHLSLHNDALVSAGLQRGLHARLARRERGWPFLVAADLEIGVDPTPGPGTRYTPYPEACRLVVEACRALARLGARRVVLMTFHGAPLHNLAVEAGVVALRRAGVLAVAPFNAILQELLALDASRFGAAVASLRPGERERALAGLPLDFHAGFFETSVALHLAPASVSAIHRDLPPCPPIVPDGRMLAAARAAEAIGARRLAAELRFAAHGLGWRALRPFPGYTGEPRLASAEAGEVFAGAILDRYEEVVWQVFDGRRASPAPILRWVGAASLGGRLGRAPEPGADEVQAVGPGG